ncbi:Iron permease FTR1 family [Synechococcus sp. PCC 7335]|uniref:FTR1 family iron permease n=1 Tax=Synechococcus sp. (strain ATCC 29403 / PCC 7335) TaxID=91464 RepID=UPI00017EC70C|nr:FTR1 family protein [Synechococcus sp. PCC 7335]EDX87096.1 Iron permease FTR1 family [Synechococcus sp. PCC 7335]
MDFSSAIPTFVVTLREGVEAALVVGIVLACLNKANRTELNRWVYAGVAAGIAGSVLIGIFLGLTLVQVQYTAPALQGLLKPLLGVLFGSVAIVMLSWMLIWMTQQARNMKGEVEGSLKNALADSEGANISVFSLVCIAVLREGFETVLFLFSNLEQSLAGISGAIAGLSGAFLIGIALFKFGVRINLKLFFQTMGVFLLLIVAGLVVSVFKNLDAAFTAISMLKPELDLCISNQSCILGPQLWDASGFLPDKRFPGILLKTLLGYRDHIYLLQAIAYASFLIGVGSRYFRSLGILDQSRQIERATNQ